LNLLHLEQSLPLLCLIIAGWQQPEALKACSYCVANGSGPAQPSSKVSAAGVIRVPQDPWADNVSTVPNGVAN
jgi:hypothetical protein